MFQEDQKVLLLLPTSASGLLTKRQGPYEIIRKTGPVTYELLLPDCQKKHQVFHVNLLREWVNHPDQFTTLWACKEEELQERSCLFHLKVKCCQIWIIYNQRNGKSCRPTWPVRSSVCNQVLHLSSNITSVCICPNSNQSGTSSVAFQPDLTQI